jgi:hypothetical protein
MVKIDVLFTLKLEGVLGTYLVPSFMMIIDVFFNVEAGARFVDLPYAFPHSYILQNEFTVKYTDKQT